MTQPKHADNERCPGSRGEEGQTAAVTEALMPDRHRVLAKTRSGARQLPAAVGTDVHRDCSLTDPATERFPVEHAAHLHDVLDTDPGDDTPQVGTEPLMPATRGASLRASTGARHPARVDRTSPYPYPYRDASLGQRSGEQFPILRGTHVDDITYSDSGEDEEQALVATQSLMPDKGVVLPTPRQAKQSTTEDDVVSVIKALAAMGTGEVSVVPKASKVSSGEPSTPNGEGTPPVVESCPKSEEPPVSPSKRMDRSESQQSGPGVRG